jgi:hypothetical protein
VAGSALLDEIVLGRKVPACPCGLSRAHGAEGYNAQHRTWVNDFAQALASWNMDVVQDLHRSWCGSNNMAASELLVRPNQPVW